MAIIQGRVYDSCIGEKAFRYSLAMSIMSLKVNQW